MTFDLAGYLSRIGHEGPTEPTVETLRAVHLAHATSIPFENVDIHLGRRIRLDVESLQEKLVRGGRGGYCFEQNALFAAALQALGFAVDRLAARVRMGRGAGDTPLPRTHMVLRVDVEGRPWLADVGFGGDGLLLPVPLDVDQPVEGLGRTHRVMQEDERLRVLQVLRPDGWVDLYAFSDEPQLPIDYELANWWTSTHPSSGFVQTLTAQRLSVDGSLILRGRDLTELSPTGEVISRTTVESDDALLQVLRERFGLALPDGATLVRPTTAA